MQDQLDEDEVKIEYNESTESDPLGRRIDSRNSTEYEMKWDFSHSEEFEYTHNTNDTNNVEIAAITEEVKEPVELKQESDYSNEGDTSSEVATVTEKVKEEISPLEKKASWYLHVTESGRYQCRFCDQTYLTVQTVRRHAKVKHVEEAKKLRNSVLKNKRNSKLKCHVCKKRFYRLKELQNHVTFEHKPGSVQFSCYFCNASFKSSKEITDHVLTHKDIKCLLLKYCHICGYRTLKKSHFYQHQRTHLLEKSFKCNSCDYETNRKGNLKIHLGLHTDLKPYSCNFQGCSYKSSTKSALASHRLKHYPNENMLICDQCGYKTVYNATLKKHMASHLNDSVKAKLLKI